MPDVEVAQDGQDAPGCVVVHDAVPVVGIHYGNETEQAWRSGPNLN
jgi:hypothetical protein